MIPTFSEFSYGYAITEELSRGILGNLKGYPMFPSIKAEGQVGGGYDVKLPRVGAPLYLQFKRSHYMVRTYSENWGLFNAPHYRMYLMRNKYSIQHELLIHLELSGEEVYYIAPEFHTGEELTEYYTNGSVFYNSALFRPSDISHLPDDKRHYVAFDHGPDAYICSVKPRKLERNLHGKSFLQQYFPYSADRSQELDAIYFDKLIDKNISILEDQGIKIYKLKDILDESDTRENKARFAGFLTRAYFDTELFIVGE